MVKGLRQFEHANSSYVMPEEVLSL